MCIAILSEGNVELPSTTVMKRCWRNNSDGAGYAYLTDKDEWHCKKGFKKWRAFKDAFDAEKFEPAHTVIIHFRVGTSGAMLTNNGGCHPDCTHPFPITNDEELLNKHEFITKNIIMHNGVHSRPTGPLSDSQIAVRDIADPLMPYWDDPKIKNMMTKLLDAARDKGNRWFIGNGANFYLLGEWIMDMKTKIWYSNSGYLPYVAPKKTVSTVMTAMQQWAGAGKADPITQMMPGREAHEFCSGGDWDWNKWAVLEKLPLVTVKECKDLIVIDKDGNVEDQIDVLYDATGNVIALVDSEGEVVWDDPLEELVDDRDAYTCGDCGAVQTIGDLIKGKCMFCQGKKGQKCPSCDGVLWEPRDGDLCPWCYDPINMNEEADEETPTCPNCLEKNHLCDSSFDQGDTECLRCGALYLNTVVGIDAIVGWNLDTKHTHDDFMRIVMDKGGEEAAG